MDYLDFNRLKNELEAIKKNFSALEDKISTLETKLNSLWSKESVTTTPLKEVKIETLAVKIKPAEPAKPKSKDLESDLGKFWLNKAGIVIFTLGIGFLISYSFKYFNPTPLMKVIFGYLISVALFFFGLKLEKKEKFVNYGRVLLGGAWAITYFTTYAMYHFEAAKVINSQLLDLILLAAVVAGIILHSLKYKSESLAFVALFIGYITATLGDISYFTFISCLFLGVSVLVLLYKMQWTRLVMGSIILTYLTHFFWVTRHVYYSFVPVSNLNVEQVYFIINNGFLLSYWLVFVVGIHLIRKVQDVKVFNKLSAANLCNFIFYFFLAYPRMFKMFPLQKFNFVFGLGVFYLAISALMEKAKNEKMFTSNILIAIPLLTLTLPLKFAPYHTNLIWLVEIPFLVYAGIIFDRKVFRYLAMGLSALLFYKFVVFDFNRPDMFNLFGINMSWNKFIAFVGVIAMSVALYLGKGKVNKIAFNWQESFLWNIFSGFATIYLTMFMWLNIDIKWLTFGLALESVFLFAVGYALKDRFIRAYALMALTLMAFRFCFLDSYNLISGLIKWFMLTAEIISVNTIYFMYKRLSRKVSLGGFERFATNASFVAACFLLVLAVFKYINHPWTSLGLGISGILLLAVGFIIKDKFFRLGGLIVFAITLVRIIFVDLAGLPVIYKMISFIVLGLIFLGASFIYTKYGTTKLK